VHARRPLRSALLDEVNYEEVLLRDYVRALAINSELMRREPHRPCRMAEDVSGASEIDPLPDVRSGAGLYADRAG